jgi:hypothetical protein
MSALLQEIISIYPVLSPPALTAVASNRVCNALALLQCVASHNDTRALFLHGEIKPLSPPPPHCARRKRPSVTISRVVVTGKLRQPVLLFQCDERLIEATMCFLIFFNAEDKSKRSRMDCPLTLLFSHPSSRSRFLSRFVHYLHSVSCVM